MLILGVHVSKSSKVLDDKSDEVLMSKAIERDISSLELNSAQIFTHGPSNTRENKLDYDKICKVTEDIDLIIHGSYILCEVWKLGYNDTSDYDRIKIINNFKNEIHAAIRCKAIGVVIHITKHTPEVIASAMISLKSVIVELRKDNPEIADNIPLILLEMVANKADDDTYECPSKIIHLVEEIEKVAPNDDDNGYYKFTIDTAHIWAAGVDIRSYDSMNKWLTELSDNKLTKNIIRQIHLNGSSKVRGSGKDKHEIPFTIEDSIWYDLRHDALNSGLAAVVKYGVKHSIPITLEINRGEEVDIRTCVNIIKEIAERTKE